MIEIQSISDVLNYTNGLKAVIFDLDDTLYSEKDYVRSGYRAVADILPQIEHAEQKLWEAFEQKKSAIDRVLMDEGIYTDELKEECLKIYRFHTPDIMFYEGVIPVFDQLKKQNVQIGIITDGRPEGQRAKILSLGLKKYVQHIIITDELGGTSFRKPCEKAFILMKERLKISYEEMCYVGDNFKKDFIAPEKLGMKIIWFRNSDGLYFET